MRKITDFFKKYWLFVLLAAIVAMLLAALFIQKSKPELTKRPSPTPKSGILSPPQSKFSQLLGIGPIYKISISEDNFDKIPQTLSVWRIKKFTKQEAISYLAKMVVDLGFLGSPEEQERQGEQYLIWKEEENYLIINTSSGQFTFIGKAPLIVSTQAQIYSSREVQNLVKQKLIEWELVSEGVKIEQVRGFGVAGLELIPVNNLDQATVFQVILSPDFNTFPLVGIGPAKNLIEAKVDNQGSLLSLFFNLHQTVKEEVDNYPTKSFKEAVKEIEEGKGQIIEVLTAKQEERSIPPEEEIKEVDISSVSIAYYETTEIQEFYQPIFLFKGGITIKDGEKYQITLFLSAISSDWLKPIQTHFRP